MVTMLTLSMPLKIETWADLVKLWPYLATLAEEINVPVRRVRGWVDRMSVPRRYHPQIVEALKAKGIEGVTVEDLGSLPWPT